MGKEKSLGAVKELFQPIREYEYETVCGASNTADYPKSFELDRSKLGTTKDQGYIGACVAEVIAQIAETFYEKEMSEGYAYAKYRNSTSKSSGMVVSTALKMYKTLGIVPKDYFDILAEMPDIKNMVENIPELDNFAKRYPISGYVSLSYADKKKKDRLIKDALTRQESGELKGYGLLSVADTYFGESHCILLTGWNDEKDTYVFKNSWGEDYGDKGFGNIPKKEIDDVYLIMFEDIKLPFTDVDENEWYYKAVKNVFCSGLMLGTGDTTFEPNKPITRAEMATLINRVTGMIDDRFVIINQVIKEKTKGSAGNMKKGFFERFRSWALWLSLASLLVFCVKVFAGIDISETVDGFMNVLLPVLVAFGIINNPTDKTSI